jgi:hypothetical protein
MPNISHFNVSDVALYYQGLVALATSPMANAVAAEEVRKRAVTYLERRRAMFSLPAPRGQLDTLGEKIVFDLRQMDLVAVTDAKIALTPRGLAIVEKLKKGEGRRARLAILGRIVETYDNAAFLCATVTPPTGKPLFVPIPRATAEEADDDEGEPRIVPANLDSICAAWLEWCRENKRPDLMPSNLQTRMEELLEASRDKRGFAEKARNALAQLVVETATGGRLAKAPIYRTVRDRLTTAGALNSVIRPIQGKPLSVEIVFSTLHVGQPAKHAKEWQRLGAKLLLIEDVWIHEAEPAALESSVLAALQEARSVLVERAGYYRIYELRDRVCEALRLSQGMFDSVFVHIYRTRTGLMTLGVDYEKITAKRLPIEIRDGATSNLFNLVAFKDE